MATGVWLADAPLPPLTLAQGAAYAYLSLAGAALAYALWFRGVARLPTVAVASLGLLSPLAAVVLGWALLGQPMPGTGFFGLSKRFGTKSAGSLTRSRPTNAGITSGPPDMCMTKSKTL
jgi:probable blue pigment (indigoidine) exporter